MGKLEQPGEVRVRRYSGCLECDVVVTFRGREMILQVPNYNQAVAWAHMEAKSYGITASLAEERAGWAGGNAMRFFIPALIVLAILYFWDQGYNNGKLSDGLSGMGRAISHSLFHWTHRSSAWNRW
jgi:hypothetical protein